MCCKTDSSYRIFSIQKWNVEKHQENGQKTFHFQGVFDHSPKTLGDRFSFFFQGLELVEKIAEIADECFHLLDHLFESRTSVEVYQMLKQLHLAAHHVEYVLHTFHVVGDLTHLFSGKFIEYRDQSRTQIDYLRTISRICHITAHFIATTQFLHELKLCSLVQFEKTFKYGILCNALGYTLWTISLLWDRFQEKSNDEFTSDLSIHLGGCVFNSILFLNKNDSILPYPLILNKVASIAGIVHAWCLINRKEIINFSLTLPAE